MKSIGSWFMGDRVIWIIFFFLCAISLVEVFSAVSTLAYGSGNFWKQPIRHAMFICAGFFVAWATHCIPCRKFRILPIFLLPLSIFFLLMALFVGGTINGTNRWLGPEWMRFQPSEIAKAALIIGVALVLSRLQTPQGADKHAIKFITGMAGLVCALIFPENLSTAVLLFGVVILMMFIGRVPLVQLGKLVGVLALVMTLFFGTMIGLAKYNETAQSEFISKIVPHRIVTWQNRMTDHSEDKGDPLKYDIDGNAQRAHANIAIVSSNYVGKMPGNSVERDFLSQAFSDFIFAIIIEETGLWGAFIVVGLYIMLLFRVGRIASRCERSFPAFLAMGLALLLVSQAMVNMFVAVGWIPITGQPLPLISRGGTSTIINCWYMGMILSVSRYARQAQHPEHTSFDGPITGVRRTDEAEAAPAAQVAEA